MEFSNNIGIIFMVSLVSVLNLSVQECDMNYYRLENENGAFVDNIVCTEVKNLTLELLDDEFYPYKYHSNTGHRYFDNVKIINSKFPKFDNQIIQKPILFHTLTISNCEIDTIESKTFESIGVMHLNLGSNGIRQLNPSPFYSEIIRSLSLSNNSLTIIKEDAFEKMTNLLRLDLSQNNIISIDGLANLISMDTLNLSFNQNLQTHFFNDLKRIPQLNKIYLNYCNLEHIPKKSLSNLRSLQIIYFDGNKFKSLRGEDFPGSLKFLSARDTNLSSLNGNWEHLTNLLLLDLSENLITDKSMMKRILGQLKHLFGFHLENNALKEFDCNVISYNKELQVLSIIKNTIKSLSNIKQCPQSIAYIFISNNEFNNSESFSHFIKLKRLDLIENKLEMITYEMFRGLYILKELNLNNNQLKSLEIGCFRDLISLSNLDLSHNFITNLNYGSFMGLRNLAALNLAHNQLEDVDEAVFHALKKLILFNLSWNKLEDFNVAKALPHIQHIVMAKLSGNKYTCSTLMRMLASSEYIYVNIHNEFNISGIQRDRQFINNKYEL